jgi:tetratricopeptide (TPR) repeat protein
MLMAGKVTDDRLLRPQQPSGGSASQALPVADELAGLPGVHRLHSAAMMAELLGVPAAALRHWVRGGLLAPVRRSGALEWFDFPQLVVGRHLARLLAGGLSLREIDAKLAGLAPGGATEAARVAERIVTDGRRLSIRDGERLLGAGGQMQFSFYTDPLHGPDRPRGGQPAILPGGPPHGCPEPLAGGGPVPDTDEAAEILDLADDLEAAGEFAEAAEALRAVLQAQGPTAPVMFMLAELLYRAGDLAAARERYYATIEIDSDHLQARASLGCLLLELGEHELALAALEGVLRQEPEFADAHWHVAAVLTALGREAEARHHLRTFLTLAPDSPWAAAARERIR